MIARPEIKDTRSRLIVIPEQVHRDGVTPHRLGHLDPMPPVFAGDAGRMHLPTDDLKRLAIQQKFILMKRKDMLVLSHQRGAHQKCYEEGVKEFIHIPKISKLYIYRYPLLMAEQLLWESDVVDWEKISVDTYKFVLDQAKERLDEIIEESQTITKRGMTILLSYIAALSGLLGYAFSEQSKIAHGNAWIICFSICIAVLSIYSFTLLFKLIYPKEVFYKGSHPKDIFYKDVFENLSTEEGYKNVLYSEIERIQDKILKMVNSNAVRSVRYRRTLKISLVLIAVAIFIIVRAIYT